MTVAIHEQGIVFKLCNNEILASLFFFKLARLVKFELQKQ
jgi:hypothetical protein